MKSKLLILLLFCPLILMAQSIYDCRQMASRDLVGSARYVSLGGAMTALGGDASAAKDNPAGLGVFRSHEITMTLDYNYTLTNCCGVKSPLHHIQVPQVSFIFSKTHEGKYKGMISNNFMFSYNRLRTFHHSTEAFKRMSVSQTDQMASCTNGLIMNDFSTENGLPWSDSRIGWLSCFGVENGLIRPTETDSACSEWTSILNKDEQVNSSLSVQESGVINYYSFAWAANFSNKVYFGIGLNFLTLRYSKSTTYGESFDDGGSYKMNSDFFVNEKSSNFMATVALGIIYRPINSLRIGTSFTTPAAAFGHYRSTCAGFENEYTDYDKLYVEPFRTTFGLAYQVNTYGLLSFEYDYAHEPKKTADNYTCYSDDAHWLKFGTEWVAAKHAFFHAGYVFQLYSSKDEPELFPSIISPRTDTEYLLNPKAHFASTGVAYKNSSWTFDLAYQCRIAKGDLVPFAFAEDMPFDYTSISHRVLFTVAFRY